MREGCSDSFDRRLIRGIGIALIAGLLATGCERKRDARAQRAEAVIPVTLAPVQMRSVQRGIEVVGTLWGDEDATVSNKVNGRVIAVYKDVGDRVAPGEPLAQLLQNDYLLDKRQKEAAVMEVLAKLGLKDVPPLDFDVTKLPSVRRAQIQVENAQAKYNRGKQLHDQTPPLISDQEFADLKAAWDVAVAGYDAELLVARGLVGEANSRQADLAIANQAVSDTTVRAPKTQYVPPGSTQQPGAEDPNRSYVVVSRMASIGELVRSVTPMFRVVDPDPLKLKANVPERHISELRIGQAVKMRVEAYAEPFDGTVARINPQVDPANRTFQVEIHVPNKDEKRFIPPGAFARATVLTRTDQNVRFVPIESVISFTGINKVFAVQDEKAVEHRIALGERQGDYVEARGDLDGVTDIVLSGVSRLANGVKVRIDKPRP